MKTIEKAYSKTGIKTGIKTGLINLHNQKSNF